MIVIGNGTAAALCVRLYDNDLQDLQEVQEPLSRAATARLEAWEGADPSSLCWARIRALRPGTERLRRLAAWKANRRRSR